MKKNVILNDHSNCYLINKAVSDKTGRTRFYLHSDSYTSSLLHPENESKYIEVETIALDDFIEEKKILPDIIKMDIESAEPLALKGMKKLLDKERLSSSLSTHLTKITYSKGYLKDRKLKPKDCCYG